MQKSENNRNEEKKESKHYRLKKWGSVIKERLAEKDEREVRERLRKTVAFLLTAVATYLLCGVAPFFGVFPICIGLICSARSHLIAVGAGILLSLFSGLPLAYGYICFAILLARMLYVLIPTAMVELVRGEKIMSRDMIKYKTDAVEKSDNGKSAEENLLARCCRDFFREELHIKLLFSALGGAVCGLIVMIESDFSFYSLCGTLILTFLSPLSLLALGGMLGEEGRIKEAYRVFSLGVIVFLTVLGAGERSLLGMPMAPFLAMLLTLYLSADRGLIYGLGAAVLCGLAFDPLYIPLLLLSALLFCVVSAVKRNAGVAVVCGLIVVWCFYIGGDSGLVGVLPPMLLAIPVYMLADKYRDMMNAPLRRVSEAEGLYFAEAVTEKTKNEAVKERLSTLSETFASLSENFYKLSDRFRRPDVLGIKEIADSAFERVCEGCRNRERCWGAEYSATLEALRCVGSSLHTKGNVEKNDFPADFVGGCVRCDKLIEEINSSVMATTEKIINGGMASFFAANYDDITAILKDALNSDSKEYECDPDAGAKICDYLYSQGFDVGGVVVYGNRCRRVVGREILCKREISAEKNREIGRRISEIVGVDMTDPVFDVGKDGNMMLLYSRPKIQASCAHGRLSRSGKEWSNFDGEKLFIDPFDDGESICGDMTDAFITDNSYFYSLISDGMGSGAQAAYTSGVCAMFIEKMLSAGNRADITLRMLNNVIRSENMGCGDECSATVDLLELDLMSGVASFIKSGAAPTYIAREGTVYKVSSRTMPVGIIKDADARITKFDTKKGDIIVMMSDGCCHDSEDCPWLVEYLCDYMTKAKKTVTVGEELCESLKDEILREAVNNSPEGEGRDDISVSVTVVG